jgi:hypothetical protein
VNLVSGIFWILGFYAVVDMPNLPIASSPTWIRAMELFSCTAYSLDKPLATFAFEGRTRRDNDVVMKALWSRECRSTLHAARDGFELPLLLSLSGDRCGRPPWGEVVPRDEINTMPLPLGRTRLNDRQYRQNAEND